MAIRQQLTGDLRNVVLGDPGVPVLPQGSLGGTTVLQLAKGVLVDDGIVTSSLEQGGLMISMGLASMRIPTVMNGSVTSH